MGEHTHIHENSIHFNRQTITTNKIPMKLSEIIVYLHLDFIYECVCFSHLIYYCRVEAKENTVRTFIEKFIIAQKFYCC